MSRRHDGQRALVVGFQDQLAAGAADLLPSGVPSGTVVELESMDDAMAILDAHPDIRLLIACLQSTQLRDLYHVQVLREQYDHVTVVVLFDVSSDVDTAQRTVLGLLSEFVQEQAGDAAGEALQQSAASRGWPTIEPEPPEAHGYRLTPRQLDVLFLVREGKSNKEIARRLDLSEGTVKIHCMSIFRVLGVANRTQAAILAEKFALEPPETVPTVPKYVDLRRHVG
ncbi:DNA-binding NarL/FixJ family response regulator [Natronocella acetinitrilica]|uniref:DNA-binding NarL/FixJ family response regulator n=1 Tax=Natronocella acetinitrilica TaxID=414046 RepID=A0AAE3G5C4_9GAMM|nr:response regulator transcription factor [Natronocella acetinitrilica]MCP1675314.1 DNA-binding NarL/FixJ family response regulator [Natronocella acetinitrilica]